METTNPLNPGNTSNHIHSEPKYLEYIDAGDEYILAADKTKMVNPLLACTYYLSAIFFYSKIDTSEARNALTELSKLNPCDEFLSLANLYIGEYTADLL